MKSRPAALFSSLALIGAMPFASALSVGCQSTLDLGAPAPMPEATADAGLPAPTPLGLRAFVTSATFTGDLVRAAGGNLDGQDAGNSLCASAAKGAGLSGNWVAYLSSGTRTAAQYIVDDGPYYAVDGTTKLYESKSGIGGRATEEIRDEKGNMPIDTSVGNDRFGDVQATSSSASFWTGSSASGEIADTCNSWTQSDVFTKGTYGFYLAGSSGTSACSNERHLLCLEQAKAVEPIKNKRVFVTRNLFKGSLSIGKLSGIAGGDALCAQAAKDGGLDGTFIAWLSGELEGKVVKAGDRLSDARYVMIDGTVAFEGKSQFSKGPKAPILINELGESLFSSAVQYVWTGTLLNGTPHPDFRCLDWSTDSYDETGLVGDVVGGGEFWTSASVSSLQPSCGTSQRLYCFEK